jgi:hypothetical protein
MDFPSKSSKNWTQSLVASSPLKHHWRIQLGIIENTTELRSHDNQSNIFIGLVQQFYVFLPSEYAAKVSLSN